MNNYKWIRKCVKVVDRPNIDNEETIQINNIERDKKLSIQYDSYGNLTSNIKLPTPSESAIERINFPREIVDNFENGTSYILFERIYFEEYLNSVYTLYKSIVREQKLSEILK